MSFTPSRLVPLSLELQGFYRLSVEQYRRMIDAGILPTEEPAELLEGFIVNVPRPLSPRAASTRTRVHYRFANLPPDGWCYHSTGAITMDVSEPEPDFAVVRGDLRTHVHRFPGPDEVGLVGEVSETSLAFDRTEKGRVYARSGIPVYWVVNVVARQVEVYTDPDPAATPPTYRTRTDYRPGNTIPVVLDGQTVGQIPVADLIH